MNRHQFSSSITIPDTTLFQESSGEAVILSLANDTYFGLDDIGTHMWNALKLGPTIQDAYEGLLEEYEIDEQTLSADLEKFVTELIENQLIQLSHA